jgi:hypothetical protein
MVSGIGVIDWPTTPWLVMAIVLLDTNCGLVNPTGAACHCRRRVPAAIAAGRVDPAVTRANARCIDDATAEIEMIYDAAQLVRSRTDPGAPQQLTDQLVNLVRSGRFQVLG